MPAEFVELAIMRAYGLSESELESTSAYRVELMRIDLQADADVALHFRTMGDA